VVPTLVSLEWVALAARPVVVIGGVRRRCWRHWWTRWSRRDRGRGWRSIPRRRIRRRRLTGFEGMILL